MAVPHERTSQCYQTLISMTSRSPSQTFYQRGVNSGQIHASHHSCTDASCIGEMSSQLHTIRACDRTTADHPYAGPNFPTRLLPPWGTLSHPYYCGWKLGSRATVRGTWDSGSLDSVAWTRSCTRREIMDLQESLENIRALAGI
jgi:hypothetical protein